MRTPCSVPRRGFSMTPSRLSMAAVLVALLLALWMWPTPSEEVAAGVDVRIDRTRRTFRTESSRDVVVPTPEVEVEMEQDTPERLQYRADMGAIADEVGLAVVECALRDPTTGGEVGRFLAFVDGVGHPDNGDAPRKDVQSTEDDFDRVWEVAWDMPEDATHATCTAELAKMFTLFVDPGATGATRASCFGTLRVGPNEHPVVRTPCTLVADGTQPIAVPKMTAGATFTAHLELADDEPEPERESEVDVERVLDLEEDTYERSAKWTGLVEGLRALRDRTPEGRIRVLLDGDIQDYGQSVEAWHEAEDEVSDKVDALLGELDEP